jgi:hypothetical protein
LPELPGALGRLCDRPAHLKNKNSRRLFPLQERACLHSAKPKPFDRLTVYDKL